MTPRFIGISETAMEEHLCNIRDIIGVNLATTGVASHILQWIAPLVHFVLQMTVMNTVVMLLYLLYRMRSPNSPSPLS